MPKLLQRRISTNIVSDASLSGVYIAKCSSALSTMETMPVASSSSSMPQQSYSVVDAVDAIAMPAPREALNEERVFAITDVKQVSSSLIFRLNSET